MAHGGAPQLREPQTRALGLVTSSTCGHLSELDSLPCGGGGGWGTTAFLTGRAVERGGAELLREAKKKATWKAVGGSPQN